MQGRWLISYLGIISNKSNASTRVRWGRADVARLDTHTELKRTRVLSPRSQVGGLKARVQRNVIEEGR